MKTEHFAFTFWWEMFNVSITFSHYIDFLCSCYSQQNSEKITFNYVLVSLSVLSKCPTLFVALSLKPIHL